MDIVELICRQTAYTEDEARERLAALGDPVKVIQAYVGARAAPAASGNANKIIYQELERFVKEVNSSSSGKGGSSPPPL